MRESTLLSSVFFIFICFLFGCDRQCPDDIFEDTMEDLRVPMLPWLEQDDWGCERKPTVG